MSNIEVINKGVLDVDVEAVVNAANKDLLEGGGVCGAIFKAANDKGLQKECDRLAPIKAGEAVITGGYNLKAKYIIHAVGPIYQNGQDNEELLASSYKKALDLTIKHDIHSIAFPCISTGIYGYPLVEATKIAIASVKEWICQHSNYDIKVIFACYKDNEYAVYKNKLSVKTELNKQNG